MEMSRLIFIFLVFLSGNIFASDLNLVHQYLHINKNGKSGQLTQLGLKTNATENIKLGISSNYLERFDLYEFNLGPQFIFKINESTSIEAKYLKSKADSEILPSDQYYLSLYQAHVPGYSSSFSYQNSNFSLTHLQWIRWGLEIEKFKHFIVIPYALLGQAHFHRPLNTREVNSLGFKVISQHVDTYRLIFFASKGIEASQALIGRSSQTIETKTIGAGLGHNFSNDLKVDALFDYSDLGKLNNQFLTTTLNFNWIF
jgi:opacity protein-like surface antigen